MSNRINLRAFAQSATDVLGESKNANARIQAQHALALVALVREAHTTFQIVATCCACERDRQTGHETWCRVSLWLARIQDDKA